MYLLAIIFGYSVTVLNLQILHTRMEAKNMRSNRIWNRVAGFMQQLRCESLSQKNMVQMPRQHLPQHNGTIRFSRHGKQSRFYR